MKEKNSLKNLNNDIRNKKYRIVISPIARNMIYELTDYIAFELCDIDAAIKIRGDLIAFIREMIVLPHRFVFDKRISFKKIGIRKAIHKKYIIYFWIDELYMTINILGVFHILTNSEQHLKEMFSISDISHHPNQGDIPIES